MLAGLSSRRRLVWAGLAALLLTLASIFTAQSGYAESTNQAEDTASQIANPRQAVPDDGPLIIVGVGGLIWPNVSQENTPTLWDLLEDPTTSAGAVTVHTVGHPACPAGGWLALSSGRPTPSPRLGTLCVEPYRTKPSGTGGTVVDWEQTRDTLAATSFEPRLGTLAAMLENAEIGRASCRQRE